MTRKKMSKGEARESITGLFEKARLIFKKSPARANKLANKARKMAMKYKLKLPLSLKRRICKHCYAYLVVGKNCRVRVKKGNVIYYCLNCKRYTKIGY